MDAQSTIELQKIDCNCNDCGFMMRDIEKYKQSLENHRVWQFNYFTVLKNKLIEKAKWWKDKFYDLEKWDSILTEADNMKFQFNRSEATINYGYCHAYNKEVTFIPNTCQIETQKCFKHRKEII